MSKHTDKIIKALPKGLSKAGVNEVASLLDEVVEERVNEEMQLLESKVKAFLRTKIDDLKSVAMHELETENELVRNNKMYEAIRSVVAADIASNDAEGVVSHLENEVSELQETTRELNDRLARELETNSLLEDTMSNKETQISELSELLEEERIKQDAPFRSSESAIVITNENQDTTTEEYTDNNGFLTEDVIRLSRLLNIKE
jgi:hypothetical protein